MAVADAVHHHAPDSAPPHGIEDIPTPENDAFNMESPQGNGVLEDKNAEAEPLNRSDGECDADTGRITSRTGCDDMNGGRNPHPDMVAENRQQHIYCGPSDQCQSPSHMTQLEELYVSNMGSGLPGYGHRSKTKSVGNNQRGYHAGFGSSLPLGGSSLWGLYPDSAIGSLSGSSNGYEFYSQQWHSSAQGFQPIPPPQNMGVRGIYIPTLPAQYQSIPWVHTAPNIYGKVLKVNSLKGLSNGTNWRARDTTKALYKIKDPVRDKAANNAVEDESQASSIKMGKVHPATTQEPEALAMQENCLTKNHARPINRDDFNKENFQISYEKAKFFVIKSYSEDDVHKSVKYGVWSSTPNGNKSLDGAYKKAQGQSESFLAVPIFLFFSVNSSGQFCGVAEMMGPVDFNKNMDFWLQGKWNGSFPVKWHIIKDVPNGHFRHIILSNNENKPVTHSRDTQEVHFHQGLEMLKIFKSFPARTSLLDDFAFYDGREKILQERKLRQQQQQQQQQMVKQFKERNAGKAHDIAVDVISDDKENGGLPSCSASAVESSELKIAEPKADEEIIIRQSMDEGKGIIVRTKEEHLDDQSIKKVENSEELATKGAS